MSKMVADLKQMTGVHQRDHQLVEEMVTFKKCFPGIFLLIVSLNSIVLTNGSTNDLRRSISNSSRERVLGKNADFCLYNGGPHSSPGWIFDRLLVFEKVPQERALPEMRTCISWGEGGKMVRQKTSSIWSLTLHPFSSFRSTKDKGGFLDSGYNSTSSTTKNNLLVNVPVKSDTQKTNLSITKNGVLGKCKKIYL